MQKKRGRKRLDLTGMEFGGLTVLEASAERAADGSIMWRCRCRCGRVTCVSSNKLRTGHTQSCGCMKNKAAQQAKNYVDGTCVEIMLSKTVPQNNTSGYRGVARMRDKWQAYITYGGRQNHLGTFDTLEDAVAARKQAEEAVRAHLDELMKS